ncbi:hypothetical protein ACB092_05G139000 [Castanea dentata]
MSPWLTGCAWALWANWVRLGSVGFTADQGNRLLFDSFGIEENLLLNNYTNPILCFPSSHSLSLSDSLLSFALVVVKDSSLSWSYSYPHKHISSPLFEILLWRPGNLLGLGCIHKSGPQTLVVFLSISGTFS